MEIRLRYFAAVREALGRGEESRTVDEGATVGSLMDELAAAQPLVAAARRSLMVMVNQEYARDDRPLRDGDEVALIPPVSGGAGEGEETERRFVVRAGPLDARLVEALVAEGGSGAVVTFTGTVRDRARGRDVVALEYEAYPAAAEKMLAQIGDEIAARWGIERAAIHHRTGRLVVGEASVVIAVASPHRHDAFDACRYAIDRLKEIVPIWKKEHYADGTAWIGSEAEYQRRTRASAGG